MDKNNNKRRNTKHKHCVLLQCFPSTVIHYTVNLQIIQILHKTVIMDID